MATATATNTVEAKVRQASDKNAARRLRTTGQIPGVLYGAGKEPHAISVDPKVIGRILSSDSGHNTIFDVNLDGQNAKAMIVDWQVDPIKGNLLHVDLKRIAMDKTLRVTVPIEIVGEAPGVKLEGGILDVVLREVDVECLPSDIPSHIKVDVSELNFGVNIRVADLKVEGQVKFLNDPNITVVHITHVKEEVAPTPEAAAEAAAAPAEPEVIKKGKQETEEGAAPAEGKGAEKPKKEK
ncbi:MAG: 50S ribosomal protein L25 [Acidobacteriaceae bacterium]